MTKTLEISLLASAALALAVALGLPAPAAGQDLHPSRRPSPMGMARINLGDAYVSVTYSRPYKRGRDNIFGTKESGALVPFGQVWRTGANEATQITLTRDFEVGGKKLVAGTYSLFTTPGPEEWAIHFNSALGLWGTDRRLEAGGFEPGYAAANDVVTVTAKPTALADEVDQFTISFEKTEAGADLVMRWIKTEVRVPFTAVK